LVFLDIYSRTFCRICFDILHNQIKHNKVATSNLKSAYPSKFVPLRKIFALQTIRLRVNDKVYKNLIILLSKFSKDEVEVIEENDSFLSIQQYFQKELASVEEGTAKYTTIEALENRLDVTIQKNETWNT
jgi:hypothetical protein